MFERQITTMDVRHVVETGDLIESYPDDEPYPSRLLLGWCGSRALHVVAADNVDFNEIVTITADWPDPTLWDEDFRRRTIP